MSVAASSAFQASRHSATSLSSSHRARTRSVGSGQIDATSFPRSEASEWSNIKEKAKQKSYSFTVFREYHHEQRTESLVAKTDDQTSPPVAHLPAAAGCDVLSALAVLARQELSSSWETHVILRYLQNPACRQPLDLRLCFDIQSKQQKKRAKTNKTTVSNRSNIGSYQNSKPHIEYHSAPRPYSQET